MSEPLSDILSNHKELGFSEILTFVKATGDLVDDSPEHYVLLNQSKKPSAIVAVSPVNFPHTAKKAARKTQKIREKLGSPENEVILEPLLSDFLGDRSYVIWPWCRELQDNKFHKIVTRLIIKKQVLNWLIEIAQKTELQAPKKVLQKKYKEPLQYVIENHNINETLRSWALEGLSKIDEGSWMPCTLLQHTDLWEGNIMFPDKLSITALKKHSFRIIDWAGALKKGYPYADLIYYCCQYEVERQSFNRYKRKYHRILQERDSCEEHMGYYLAASLGYVGLHKGEFQNERYLELIDKLVGFVVDTLD